MKTKKFKHPLSRTILVAFLLFTVILCVIMGAISFVIFRNDMMNYYEGHLTDIMELTLARIDAEDLEKCIETKEYSPEYEELLEYLDQVRQNYSLDYIVIIAPMRVGDDYDVMQVASGLLKDERKGTSLKKIEIPLLGDMMGQYYPEGFVAMIYDDMINRHDIKFSTSATDFGRSYDAATSIRKSDGEAVALLTAGISLNDIDLAVRRYITVIAISALILAAIFIAVMMFWFRKRIIFPLQKIEKSAADFAQKSHSQKDPNALVLDNPEIHTGDELESLSDTIISMSHDMKDYVEDLLRSSDKMEYMALEMTKVNDFALRDALTGVKNKAAYDKIEERLNADIITHTASFGMIMIDINFLKKINDTFGHESGDLYIKNMCALICDTFEHSPVFRIGGDEFVVLLENRDFERCNELIDKLKKQMNDLQGDKNLHPWERLSAAIGCAIYNEDFDDSAYSVLKRADKAMYENKKEMKAVRT